MPPQVRRAPGYNSGNDSSKPSFGMGSCRLFKPEHESKITFMKPAWDRKTLPLTVFRPFPCRAYDETSSATGFEPYRVDAPNKNFFGYWLQILDVADRLGNPPVTFAIHNPFSGNRFDPRTSPLSVLSGAVEHAVKRGQGKAESWRQSLGNRNFEPSAQETLEWSGMQSGSTGAKAALSRPTKLFLMQGYLPMHGGKEQWGADKLPPGWGVDSKSCIFGLTFGAGLTLLDRLNEEVENYRGDPADFENRYVSGDPVSVQGGRFLYVYPKGGDPRQVASAQAPSDFDPLSQTRSAPGGRGQSGKEDIGFDMHFEKTFQGRPAALDTPNKMEMVKSKWLYWEDILWFPTEMEQVQILSNVLPASMIEYAFVGERDKWLTEDIKKKITSARSASVPASEPSKPRHESAYQGQPFERPSAPAKTSLTDPHSDEVCPWDGPVEVTKADAVEAFADAVTGDIGDSLLAAADQASALFGSEVPEASSTVAAALAAVQKRAMAGK